MTTHRYQIASTVAILNLAFATMSQVAAMDVTPKPPMVRLEDAVGSVLSGIDVGTCELHAYSIEMIPIPYASPPIGLIVDIAVPMCRIPLCLGAVSLLPSYVACSPLECVLPPLMPPQGDRVPSCRIPLSLGAGTFLPPHVACAPVEFVPPPLLPPQGDRVPLKLPELSLETPSGCSSPRHVSFAFSPPSMQSAFSTAGLSVKQPVCGIDQEFAQTTTALIVFNGLLDSSFDPRLPQWRPYLAYLIANPKKNISPDIVLQLMFSGCEGIDDFACMTVAENWARRFDAGKFYGDITYAIARSLFNSGKYPESALKCSEVGKSCPALAVRVMILKALSEAYSGDTKQSHRTLIEIKKEHADSPEMPEVHYMEAWLALQEMRIADAKSILKSIVSNTPQSPAAAKATKILESLETPQ